MDAGRYPSRLNCLLLLVFLLAGAGTTSAQEFTPQEVTASERDVGKIVDPEFDELLGRFCWISEGSPSVAGDESLWIGYIDPRTGLFDPPGGSVVRVDFGDIVGVKSIGNGCEWVFTDVGAQIVYTKTTGSTLKDRVIARAAFTGGRWVAGLIEDAEATSAPIGSLDRGDPTPHIAYQGFTAPNTPGDNNRAIYVRALSDPTSERMIPTTDLLFSPGARWVPDADSVIFTRPMPRATEKGERQVFIYDTTNERLQQVTRTDTVKHSASMWAAPEYGGEKVVMALEDETFIGIYRRIDDDGDGIKTWTRVNIVDPPATGTYIWSPEATVVDNRSYIVMNNSTSDQQQSLDIPTEIWLAGIDPNEPFYRKISDDRELVRKDPELVVLPGDLPLIQYGDEADYTLTESLTTSVVGQVMAIGSSASSPAGGRNAMLVFELPPLDEGRVLSQANVGVQLLTSFSQSSMHADLWAVSISTDGVQPLAFLEADDDPDTSRVKIADDLLTAGTETASRVSLNTTQASALADYLMEFYNENPGYQGGARLHLRLNPDSDNGTASDGWTIASSNHHTETVPTLTLSVGGGQDVPGDTQDYSLTEDLQVVEFNQLLRIGSDSTAPEGAEGRNAILLFELPALSAEDVVSSAELSFIVGGNSATPGLNADLWALNIGPARYIRDYSEFNLDPSAGREKIADNILTESTPVNRSVSTNPGQSGALADYLMAFYQSHPLYQGGAYVYLRLNPDNDTGSSDAGWFIYSADNQVDLSPSLNLSVQSRDKVWVYISVGGVIHRLETGLGAPAE